MNIQSILKRVLVSFVIAGGLFGGFLWYATKEPKMGGDFTLNFRGQEWNFKSHNKPLNLLYIGYVKCPDVCPLTLSHASQAFAKLTDQEKSKIQLIFLSVDYQNDTPESVADYAAQFSPGFLGMTGTEAQVDHTVNLFGASYMVEKNPESYLGYAISHTDRLFYLDENGYIIDSIAGPKSAEEIINKIKEHL